MIEVCLSFKLNKKWLFICLYRNLWMQQIFVGVPSKFKKYLKLKIDNVFLKFAWVCFIYIICWFFTGTKSNEEHPQAKS